MTATKHGRCLHFYTSSSLSCIGDLITKKHSLFDRFVSYTSTSEFVSKAKLCLKQDGSIKIKEVNTVMCENKIFVPDMFKLDHMASWEMPLIQCRDWSITYGGSVLLYKETLLAKQQNISFPWLHSWGCKIVKTNPTVITSTPTARIRQEMSLSEWFHRSSDSLR